MEYDSLKIPYSKSSVLHYIHENGNVTKEEYMDDGIEIEFSIQEELAHRVDCLLNITKKEEN